MDYQYAYAAEFLGVGTGSSGTWMIDTSQKLSQTEDIKLAVACVYGKTFKEFEYKNIVYYCLPGNRLDCCFFKEI